MMQSTSSVVSKPSSRQFDIKPYVLAVGFLESGGWILLNKEVLKELKEIPASDPKRTMKLVVRDATGERHKGSFKSDPINERHIKWIDDRHLSSISKLIRNDFHLTVDGETHDLTPDNIGHYPRVLTDEGEAPLGFDVNVKYSLIRVPESA